MPFLDALLVIAIVVLLSRVAFCVVLLLGELLFLFLQILQLLQSRVVGVDEIVVFEVVVLLVRLIFLYRRFDHVCFELHVLKVVVHVQDHNAALFTLHLLAKGLFCI